MTKNRLLILTALKAEATPFIQHYNLRKNEFKVKHIKRFSLELNPFSWLQTLLNISGVRFNLLYDLLKSSELRDGDIETINLREIISTFLLLPIYFPIALILSVL